SAGLLAPLPVEHDRDPLEAETLPQTTLQVTYIILDPISSIVHIQSERWRLRGSLGRVVELEVPAGGGGGRPYSIQDVVHRLVQLRSRDHPGVFAVDLVARGEDPPDPGARLR